MPPSLALLTTLISVALAQTRSAKRGLVYVPSSKHPQDDDIWVSPGSDITWYLNYASTPAASYADKTQDQLEFVPMLFGSIDDKSFLDTVTGLITGGRNISHVLTFNEPDGVAESGGSNVAPAKAAQIWVDNVVPLRERGIKVGLPACTGGPTGLPWLQGFLANCSQLITPPGGKQQNCSFDFVALHWYGNFEGLASHMGEYSAAFPNTTQWITEYNFDHQDLETTQSFFNESSQYFDRLDSVDRYSLFGAFRSDVSNIGPNGAMLNKDGKLTDIGSWYLGGVATNVKPSAGMTWRGQMRLDVLVAVTLAVAGYIVL